MIMTCFNELDLQNVCVWVGEVGIWRNNAGNKSIWPRERARMIICMNAVHAYVQACSLSSSNYVLLFWWDEDRWIWWCRTAMNCDDWMNEWFTHGEDDMRNLPNPLALQCIRCHPFSAARQQFAINKWANKTNASGVLEELTNYWTTVMLISANCYELSYHIYKHLQNQSMNKGYGIHRHINYQEFWNVLSITVLRDAHKIKASTTTNTCINQW